MRSLNCWMYCAALVAAVVASSASKALAAELLAPGDLIIAIDVDPPYVDSNYPAPENPGNLLDSDPTTKYLNFGKTGSGFIVTPLSGSSTVQSFQLNTANDAEARDPASFELYGTNSAISSADNSDGNSEPWTLISAGDLFLPSARVSAGSVISFANVSAYTSYKMLFPTVKDAINANSMQLGDAAFFESNDGSGPNVLSPGDAVIAVDNILSLESEHFSFQGADKVIDGTTDKYLNFGEENSGFIVEPGVGASIVTSFQITTAFDAEARDPASWALYGTNDPVTSTDNSRGDAEAWTLIDAGSIVLPADRNTLGPIVNVSNSTAYSAYRMVFPTVKDANDANSMQIAEVQFNGRILAIPEPTTAMLSLIGLSGLVLRRRRA